MRAVLIDMHFGRNSGLAQRHVEHYAILGGHGGIGVGVEEKSGRRLRGHLKLVRQVLHEFRIGALSEQIP